MSQKGHLQHERTQNNNKNVRVSGSSRVLPNRICPGRPPHQWAGGPSKKGCNILSGPVSVFTGPLCVPVIRDAMRVHGLTGQSQPS